jgi:hypothetical protein
LAVSAFAQNNPQGRATTEMSDGCGAKDTKFNVKTVRDQHPTGKPEEGKALVYVIEQ